VDNNETAAVEVANRPDPDDREGGAYEVFLYDRHNTCLDQEAFYYFDRKSQRQAMNMALEYAADKSKPFGIKFKRTNF
jgi:hypothetical protein